MVSLTLAKVTNCTRLSLASALAKRERANWVFCSRQGSEKVMSAISTFKIATDMSTIAIFDLKALEHRIDEDGDWWTSDLFPELEAELANSNLYLIDTSFDGLFEVSLFSAEEIEGESFINCPSGRVHIVCGEEIPGEGLTPELLRGGYIHTVSPGKIKIAHTMDGYEVRIEVCQQQSTD